jgi:hypothetical protein
VHPARDWPDAFRPDLAASLATLANLLDGDGPLERALECNREAIETIRPVFLATPMAVVQWTVSMCREYMERCERAGRTPDAALLQPIADKLQELQATDEA